MTETLEDKKQRCKDLIRKKDEMEKEMDTLFEYFERPDVKTFKIIEDDGYPNEDSGKIYEVRLNKNKLASKEKKGTHELSSTPLFYFILFYF